MIAINLFVSLFARFVFVTFCCSSSTRVPSFREGGFNLFVNPFCFCVFVCLCCCCCCCCCFVLFCFFVSSHFISFPIFCLSIMHVYLHCVFFFFSPSSFFSSALVLFVLFPLSFATFCFGVCSCQTYIYIYVLFI
ncbi:hypothetical protein, conserved [Trypanosoma brucei brucei TREU927]|uniref:T. brucei spp.-specific protein n=1 Tax=Trypanosoma brucei brucei (strain 927/4 GUTat10.1) TaxID=185431 RepID=Q388A4_TRYB2|nr:hypothetical protein, conserved [Trypanosoma brucei brucei TREU927]EAN78868.1 hypothetical protein, conserved [Trypanosoma brucei brucei TREU927]